MRRRWAEERNEATWAARAYPAGEGQSQSRLAPNMLRGRFHTDFDALVATWADWATTQVKAWPDDPRQAEPDCREIEETVRRARW